MMARIVIEAERHIKERAFSEPAYPGHSPVDRRNHLRSNGARCRRSRSARHCCFHRVRFNRPSAFEIPPQRPDLRPEPQRSHDQPPQPAVGHCSHTLPQGQYHRGAGRCCREPARTGRLCPTPRSHCHRCGNAHQIGVNQLPSPARDGRAQPRRCALLRSARRRNHRTGARRGQNQTAASQARQTPAPAQITSLNPAVLSRRGALQDQCAQRTGWFKPIHSRTIGCSVSHRSHFSSARAILKSRRISSVTSGDEGRCALKSSSICIR